VKIKAKVEERFYQLLAEPKEFLALKEDMENNASLCVIQ
jgi:hypothetical protein